VQSDDLIVVEAKRHGRSFGHDLFAALIGCIHEDEMPADNHLVANHTPQELFVLDRPGQLRRPRHRLGVLGSDAQVLRPEDDAAGPPAAFGHRDIHGAVG
jgi:hypothetical protein